MLDLTVVASLLAAPIWLRRTSSFTLTGPPIRTRYQGSWLRRWTVPITGYLRTHAIRLGYRLGMSPDAAARVAVTMTDQCFASGSNFLVGIAVARIAGPAGLGAFSLAYGCWILLNLIHRSLITDPMAIFRDMTSGKASEAIRHGIAAEIILGLVATALFVALGIVLRVLGLEAFGNGVLAVAPWIVFLDIQDFWRWIGFMQGKPGKSLANDVFFTVIQTVAFGVVFVFGMHSVFAVVAAWGIGALAGSVYGLFQFCDSARHSRWKGPPPCSVASDQMERRQPARGLGPEPALPAAHRSAAGPGFAWWAQGGSEPGHRAICRGHPRRWQLRAARGKPGLR